MENYTRREILRGLTAFLGGLAIGNLNGLEALAEESYKTSDLNKDSEEMLLARMLYGEARGCSKEEKIAIAYTALNRNKDEKKWNGENNLKTVLLKKRQYSCFNEKDPNRTKLMNPDSKIFEECLEVARGVLNKRYKDPTNGATHYHTRNIKPNWDYSKLEERNLEGNFKHKFYKEN
ncbi:cell wall hydrolase [Candidatus Woesearchaeota archaeon]|nr:cell wall hydrolase [Candidatus Woesearchaeota archaeon]